MIPFNENKELCSKCDGCCCKKVPGIFFPSDFDTLSKDILERMLRKRFWQVTFCGDENTYYIMPNVRSNRFAFNPFPGGICVFFKKNEGCLLEFNFRPTQCKALVPREGRCVEDKGYEKDDCIKSWNTPKYQKLIRDTINAIGLFTKL